MKPRLLDLERWALHQFYSSGDAHGMKVKPSTVEALVTIAYEALNLRQAMFDSATVHAAVDRLDRALDAVEFSVVRPKVGELSMDETVGPDMARRLLEAGAVACPRCGGDTTERELTYSGCAECQEEARTSDMKMFPPEEETHGK